MVLSDRLLHGKATSPMRFLATFFQCPVVTLHAAGTLLTVVALLSASLHPSCVLRPWGCMGAQYIEFTNTALGSTGGSFTHSKVKQRV